MVNAMVADLKLIVSCSYENDATLGAMLYKYVELGLGRQRLRKLDD